MLPQLLQHNRLSTPIHVQSSQSRFSTVFKTSIGPNQAIHWQIVFLSDNVIIRPMRRCGVDLYNNSQHDAIYTREKAERSGDKNAHTQRAPTVFTSPDPELRVTCSPGIKGTWRSCLER